MISVVVPAYNAEKWIGRCLDSLLCQTYADMEILVVDDGSGDQTGRIMDEYAARDSRIQCFHNRNHGVGYSRNYGIEKANGTYIAFVDSDDYVEPDYFSKLMEPMSDPSIDLSICGYKIIDETPENKRVTPRGLSCTEIRQLTGNINHDLYLIREFINSPCLKLYSLRHILDYAVRFPEDMITGEDLVFNLRYYHACKAYKYIDYTGYCYVQQGESVTHTTSIKLFESGLRAYNELKRYLMNNNVREAGKLNADQIYGILQRFVIIDEQDTLGRYLSLMNRLEEKRSYARLESGKKTAVMLLYKTHMLWLYYLIARSRRRNRGSAL